MRIKKLRVDKGLSQAEFARLIGVTQKAVAKYEAGVANPRAACLPRIAKTLNCTIEELYDEGETA